MYTTLNSARVPEHALPPEEREPHPTLDDAVAVAVGDLLAAIGDPWEPWSRERARDLEQCTERVRRVLGATTETES